MLWFLTYYLLSFVVCCLRIKLCKIFNQQIINQQMRDFVRSISQGRAPFEDSHQSQCRVTTELDWQTANSPNLFFSHFDIQQRQEFTRVLICILNALGSSETRWICMPKSVVHLYTPVHICIITQQTHLRHSRFQHAGYLLWPLKTSTRL